MDTTPPAWVRRGEVGAALGGGSLLLASWLAAAASEQVPALEVRVFEAVNRLPGPIWPVVWAPMQLGSYGGSIAVVAAVAKVSRDARLTGATFAATQAAFWAAKAVKRRVRRGRPHALLVDVRVRERATGLGFVSGHSAVALAAAAAVAPSCPVRWQPVAPVLAGTVMLGRLHGGAHLPLDVVGGAGVGLLCGTLARWALRLDQG